MEVSVLIPVYNRQSSIPRAIQSVLNQTFQDFELVIIDDGSQDGTLDAVRTFTDDRIKVIKHSKNLGSSAARNTGLRSSLGRYVAFLDSDDEWLPEKLSLQLESLHEKQGEFAANVSGFYLYDDFNIKRKEIPSRPVSWHKSLLMGCGLGGGTTLIVDRKAFDEIGYFDTSLLRYADWDWLLRFTSIHTLTITPDPLAIVYRNSKPKAQVVEKAAEYFIEKHHQEFLHYGYYGKRAIGKRYLEVSIYYFLEGDRQAGWRLLKKAIFQSPFQRPSMYLRIVDALLGTAIVPTFIRFRSVFQKVGK